MSKYTTEVRYICERAAGLDESKGFNDVSDILDKAVGKVFNFHFLSLMKRTGLYCVRRFSCITIQEKSVMRLWDCGS